MATRKRPSETPPKSTIQKTASAGRARPTQGSKKSLALPMAETPPAAPAAPAAAREKAAAPVLPARLVELFGLSHVEQRTLSQLLASFAPLSIATLAERLGLGLIEVLALFGHEGTLRARGLVEVLDQAALGWPLPTDEIQPGRGLHLWCGVSGPSFVDESALFKNQAPGVTYIPAPAPSADGGDALPSDKRTSVLSDLVREHLMGPKAVLLWLGEMGPDLIGPFIQIVRARLKRPVLCIEGSALAGFSLPQLYAALRRLRRDADLRGAAVVVSGIRQLGAAWRALCHPRPIGQTAPVILCASDALSPLGQPPQGASGETPLTSATAALRRSTQSAAAPAGDAIAESSEDPTVLASREDARRRAALDAARAMGRPVPADLADTPRAAIVPAAPAAPAAPATPAPRQPVQDAAPTPQPEAPRPANPRLAAALAKAGLPPAGSSDYQKPPMAEPKAPPQATRPLAPPPAPLPPPAPAPVPALEPAAAADADAASSDAHEEEQPPLPLPEDAPIDEILRVARTTPNLAQRIQLMQRLLGTRSQAVIQLFRTNLTSPHPGVRRAAEAGMESLFGANWNRSRPIPPPVQPPRSDDGGRGPGGAF